MSKTVFPSRMKKTLVMVLAVTLMGFGPAGAAENRGPEKIDIKAGAKGVVAFSHHKHQDALKADCKVCHALFPQATDSIDKLIAEGKLKKKEAMNQCVKCHRQTEKEGQKSGPVKCGDCHPK